MLTHRFSYSNLHHSWLDFEAKSPNHSINRNCPTCARCVRQPVTPEMRLPEVYSFQAKALRANPKSPPDHQQAT